MTTPEQEPAEVERGLLDTSVVIGLGEIEPERLPRETAVTALPLAKLAAGPRATDDAAERARRQDARCVSGSGSELVPDRAFRPVMPTKGSSRR